MILSQATTFTITDCPCTVTAPVIVSTVTDCTTWYGHLAGATRGSSRLTLSSPGSSTVLSSVASSPALVTETPVAPVQPPVASGSAPVYTNGTGPISPAKPTTVGTAGPVPTGPGATGTSPAVPVATGAANKAFVASGAALAGLVGLVVYVL